MGPEIQILLGFGFSHKQIENNFPKLAGYLFNMFHGNVLKNPPNRLNESLLRGQQAPREVNGYNNGRRQRGPPKSANNGITIEEN